MKKLLCALMVSVLGITALVPADRASAAPYCGITWGSLPKVLADAQFNEELVTIRTGQHECYDRMVVDLNGPAAGYDVRYVGNVYTEGTNQLIPLAGGAKLQIIVTAPSIDIETGQPLYPGKVGHPLPGVNVAGYRTFRDAKFAGTRFVGNNDPTNRTKVGLGVRAQLPFRVFKLDNRVVIDVAHKW